MYVQTLGNRLAHVPKGLIAKFTPNSDPDAVLVLAFPLFPKGNPFLV